MLPEGFHWTERWQYGGDELALKVGDRTVAQLMKKMDGVTWYAVLRVGPPEHFTVGVLVLDATLTSALLTLHGKAHRWFQLGGHTDAITGVDTSRVSYACDMVLVTEFESQSALEAYATHPMHLAAKGRLEGLRIAIDNIDEVVALIRASANPEEARNTLMARFALLRDHYSLWRGIWKLPEKDGAIFSNRWRWGQRALPC